MSKMKYLVAILALLVVSVCRAVPQPDSAATASTAVTLASDTVVDDTSGYVISTSIPKGLTKMMQSMANGIYDDSGSNHGGFSWLPWNLFGSLLGMAGVALFVFVMLGLLFPIALVALLVWLLVRGRKRARNEDMRSRNTPERQPDETESYIHRRDNAIRNICIGGGVLALSAVLELGIGMVAGTVVLCVGMADYLVYRNHRKN